MSRENGSVIGVDNTPTTSAASGVWSMNAVARAVKAAIWPNNEPTLRLDFDETTTLDSRITFTRATSATYFDSSGVLQTASSGVARFDHRLESSVWVNKGLLIEEQRTNSNTYSEQFDNAAWTKSECTVTADDETAPDGNTTADRIVPTTASAAHVVSQSISLTSGVTYSFSCFAKAGEYSRLLIGRASGSASLPSPISGTAPYFDLSNGTVVGTPANGWAYTIENVGSGWYRIVATITAAATGSNGMALVIVDDSGNISFVGDTSKGLYIWGAQQEAGAFPTSYIKTTTASVTRNDDQASMTGTDFSDWYNATEGTVFWQGSSPFVSAKQSYSISNNTSAERIFLAIIDGSGNVSRLNVIDGSVAQAAVDSPNPKIAAVAGKTYKHAAALMLDNFAASLDGNAATTDTSGTMPTVDRVYLGANESGASGFLNGYIAKFYYWNTRKSDSFLQNITS